jgi:hypothetical protein
MWVAIVLVAATLGGAIAQDLGVPTSWRVRTAADMRVSCRRASLT